MAFFQNSVLNKHLKGQDEKTVKVAYQKFVAYFHNPAIQQNIRDAKEEQFQEGFLRELFVDILGYTLNPQPEFNLTTELKNEKGAKKADGAILHNGKALGVIELKGTDTKDLDKINVQAFNYKNNQTGCVYVITSNFEKLRFFIHHSVEHLEFNLFTLTETEFQLLWLCLSVENLLNGIPLKVKEESLHEEEKITKQLYKDYAAFRNDLWQNMVKNNAVADKLVLFKKTQKLLDRFLFILFAEDSGLLPPNSISRIIKRWEVLKAEDAYKPLYDIFKQYFGYIDRGRKGQKTVDDIFAYNGGLFLPDALLDTILIDDDILHAYVLKLTKYDFQSEVDVNILGHIFENSLNEIESITAQLEGHKIDKSKTKRKKDGVFYTPKYITKYIVDNTVGKLCDERKEVLGIVDEEYAKGRKNRKKDIVQGLDANLQAYRNWLLNITICDPACGSGAFLNQALEFLMEEHTYIDELESQLLGHAFEFPGVENHILEKNIFGVDINEESVDIAKLSLWLRTAQRGRKLTSLNNNLKCGNSLIDDPSVAGVKAFNWKKEFPNIFDPSLRGTKQSLGFDVVIGNPPYVRAELLTDFLNYFEKKYKVFHPASDLFAYFYELGTKIINNIGLMGFISNTFDKTTAGKVLREYLTEETTLKAYTDFTEMQIFEGATTYPVIIILNKSKQKEGKFDFIKIPKSSQSKVIDIEIHNKIKVSQDSLDSKSWSFSSLEKSKILVKISLHPKLREIFGKCYYGVKTALNDAFIINENWAKPEHIKPILEGKEIKKWNVQKAVQKLILFESKWTNKNYAHEKSEDDKFNALKRDFPQIMEHLLPFKERAIKRYDQGDYWWELRNCAYYDLFDKPKIIFPNLQNSNKFCLDNEGTFVNAPAVFLPTDNKALLCVLNSKIVWEFLKSICVVRSGGYIEVKPQYFEQIPIPELKNERQFEGKATDVILYVNDLQRLNDKFQYYLTSHFLINKLTRKLENWYELEFADFIKELNKAIKKAGVTVLTKKDEFEWLELFEDNKKKAQELQTQIHQTEKEIDQMVYQLYGLTYEEIKIVEQY
tara:strand:- start:6781 stop:9948 length:3168 start_codon:yes stop_codon:yes gene_type:complete